MFDCLGKSYTILTWTDNGICIGEQNNDDDDHFYDNAEQLVKSFKINNIPLCDISDKVIITFSS